MIIDSRNNVLIRTKTTDLTPLETKVVMLMSDNNWHSLKDISDFLQNNSEEGAKAIINRIHQKCYFLRFEYRKSLRLYRMKNKMFVR